MDRSSPLCEDHPPSVPPPSLKNPRLTESLCILLELSLPPSLPLLSRIPDLQNHFVYCWNYHCPPPSPFSQESQTYRITLYTAGTITATSPPPSPFSQESQTYRIALYTAGTITAPLPPPSLKNPRLTESLCILLELSLPPSLPLLSRIPDLQNHFVYCWNYHCPPPSPFSQESQTYRIILYTAGTITAPLPPPSLKNPRLTESLCILLELSLPPSLPLLSRIPDLQNHFVYCWNYHCPPPSPFSQESQTYRITLYTAGTITATSPPPPSPFSQESQTYRIALYTAGTITAPPPSPFSQKSQTYRTTLYTAGTITAPLLPLLSRIPDLQNHFVYCWKYYCPPSVPPPSLKNLRLTEPLCILLELLLPPPPSLPLLPRIPDLQNHFVYCWNYYCPPSVPPPSPKNPRLTESLCILLELSLPPSSPFSQESQTYRITLYTAGNITAPPSVPPPSLKNLRLTEPLCILLELLLPPLRPSPFSQESQTYRTTLYTAGTITAPPPSLPLLPRIPDLQNHFVYCWNYHCHEMEMKTGTLNCPDHRCQED